SELRCMVWDNRRDIQSAMFAQTGDKGSFVNDPYRWGTNVSHLPYRAVRGGRFYTSSVNIPSLREAC
ncbi:MAG: hypothetical protein IKW68_03160, partial [Clostridia bacterium]|nr:hypothetical protein [Clostridia bacterium]